MKRRMKRHHENWNSENRYPAGHAGELGMIGLTNALGELVCEPFNPNDERHIALMEVFADGCPECRAILQGLRSGQAEAAPPMPAPPGAA